MKTKTDKWISSQLARSHLPPRTDPRFALHSAIVESKWGSPRAYARERHGVCASSWTSWTTGKLRVSAKVIARIAADFPGVSLDWITRRKP
jgi:hypothetical protein